MALKTRAEALAILTDGQSQLEALFSRLSDPQLSEPRTIGGGDWSAKDLMGHIAFWEELALDLIAARREGRPPRIDEVFGSGGVDKANAADQAANAAKSLAKVRKRAEKTHAVLKGAIQTLPDEEWRQKTVGKDGKSRALGEGLASVLGAPKMPFGHAWAHLEDLRTYVESL